MVARPLVLMVACLALWGGVMAWVLSSTNMLDVLNGKAGEVTQDREKDRGQAAEGIEGARDQAGRFLDTAPRAAWRAARIGLAGGAVLALVLLGTRWWTRRHRRHVRMRLIPFRSEEVPAEDVRRLFETLHQQVLERWWRRIPFGQPGLALEIATVSDPEGGMSARLGVVCPLEHAIAVEGSLLSCFHDSRLVREEHPVKPPAHVARLKKRHHFVRALRSAQDERTLVDSVLRQMASLPEPSLLQLVLVPTPAIFDRYSRGRFRAVERRSERPRAVDPSHPGLRSEVLGQELSGGMRLQHRPLFFADIRIGTVTRRACDAIAGIVRGESGAENRLVIRYLHAWARGPLYAKRIVEGLANPLPGWRHCVYSSTELAAIWDLPSPGLKSVRLRRAPLPRIPAPPEISRDPAHALAKDDRGAVGIRPEDKTDGLGLIGGQKTGKTSLLCRTVQADALDPTCALVVLMPKPGDALKALSMIPKDRTVHYLDLERPEVGINPLLAQGDPAMVADKVVEAFRDVNMEGDIRGSSDRYLRQAAQAAIGACRAGVLEGPPTLWQMYRMLLPSETAFRERVVEALLPDPRFTDTATFFGRELPHDLEGAPGPTVTKLDAPRNKILRLLVESLDKVLRHPKQLSLDELVQRREVLIVDGKMGTFGADNCRVMMQFILNSLYGTLQRQQQLPESERTRVALKVDEAHLVINDSFADALATLRSAGLEVVAAWQYSEQIQDPKIRAGMMSLLRQRCMFSMGESSDARELSSIAMSVYADVIHADPESQMNLRVTPDTILNLPNHHAVCSWISHGARVPAFMAQTIPLDTDDAVVLHHLEAQRGRGGHVPDRLPDPLPAVDHREIRELPTEVIAETSGSNGQGAAGNGAPGELVFDGAGTSRDASEDRRAERPAEGAPDTYTELDLDDVRGVNWDKVVPIPAERRHEPTQRELDILAALWSHRLLFASQIWRRWWRGSTLRACQRTLNKMAKAGWVRRFRFQMREWGAQQRVYCLTRQGFELAQQRTGRRGPYIDPQAKWREPEINDPRRILRSLHVNGWVLAFHQQAARIVVRWRGPREGRIDPPRRRVRGEWIKLRPSDLKLEGGRQLRDYEAPFFESVNPDATLEIRIPVGDSPLRFDLLIEFDGSRNAASAEQRLRRYDGLISGWAATLDRYRAFGTPPVVVFLSETEQRTLNLLKVADRVVTGRLAKAGTEEVEWPCPARRAMFFAVERDMHFGSLEALQLPEHPPDVRVRLGGPGERACYPRRVNFIEPRLLRREG